jgi:hypothetical protein
VTIKIGTLDLGWVQEFKERVSEAKDLLSSVSHLAKTTMQMMEFLYQLKNHPGVRTDTKINFALIAHFNTEENGKKEDHTLQIKAASTAPTMIQALMSFAGEHCENLKKVEQDTPKLQEVLGAVSEFKDTVLEINPPCDCNGCTGRDKPENKPN